MNSLHLLQRRGWKREEGRRRCKIVARSRSITFVCGSTRVHTRSIRAGSIDRSIDRRIIEPTVPCNIVSGGSEGETKEEKAEGERGAFRFQAYFITKPQFLPGFAVVSPRRERKREREREREEERKEIGRGGRRWWFVPWARGYLRALLATSRLLPSFQRWLSTLRKDFLPFTIHLSFYERTGKFVAHQRGTG